MENKTVVITEKDGKYEIQNNGMSEFALLGILECIVFELKTAKTQNAPAQSSTVEKESVNHAETFPAENPVKVTPDELQSPTSSAAPTAPATDIRKRIANAVKAIKDLGGQVPSFDAAQATDEELHEELAALTEQYKRLKSSKAAKK